MNRIPADALYQSLVAHAGGRPGFPVPQMARVGGGKSQASDCSGEACVFDLPEKPIDLGDWEPEVRNAYEA
jgi:hypothetical protein